jgi:hypothetical protein
MVRFSTCTFPHRRTCLSRPASFSLPVLAVVVAANVAREKMTGPFELSRIRESLTEVG